MPAHGKPFLLPALRGHRHIDALGFLAARDGDTDDAEAVVFRFQAAQFIDGDTSQLRRRSESAPTLECSQLCIPPVQSRAEGGVFIPIPTVSEALPELLSPFCKRSVTSPIKLPAMSEN